MTTTIENTASTQTFSDSSKSDVSSNTLTTSIDSQFTGTPTTGTQDPTPDSTMSNTVPSTRDTLTENTAASTLMQTQSTTSQLDLIESTTFEMMTNLASTGITFADVEITTTGSGGLQTEEILSTETYEDYVAIPGM